jgi:hypothetical protein
MRYIILVLALFSVLSSGCLATKLFIPDVDTRMSQKELTHVDKINKDFNITLLALANKSDLATDKGKLNFAKLAYKASLEATDVQPSAAENMIQQYMRMAGQGTLDAQLNQGFEWSKKLITEVAGGGLAGAGGIGWLLTVLRRKNKALKVVSSELDETAKAKVKKALEHTGSEKEVT